MDCETEKKKRWGQEETTVLKSDSWEHLTRIKGGDTNYPRPSCNYGRRDILVVLKEAGLGGGCDELMTEDFCSSKASHLTLYFSLHIHIHIPLEAPFMFF